MLLPATRSSRWFCVAIELSSHDAFLAALSRARRIDLSAYCLGPPILRALEEAADGGARVTVRLESDLAGDRSGARAAANARAVRDLAAHGAHAMLAEDDARIHAKAAIVDGVAWLDDRNFPASGPNLIVRDTDAGDVAAVRQKLAGETPSGGRLCLTKTAALAIEVATIAGAPPGEIDVESESFNGGTISHELTVRAAAGDHVRLLVDAREARGRREARALANLAKRGVEIRLCGGGVDKMAVCGDRAWIGSANATFPDPRTALQSDWGLATLSAGAVGALRERFEASWSRAHPLTLAWEVA